ncbi:MAG TPA: succinate--CoA ligase subunit alpha [Fibrobacteria bacterium]|nr:succinate--CoA ligase subunit alpha [Fibrobacteria bacterium]
MSIFVDKNTKVVVVGLTGKAGSFHAAQCKAYGTQIVAGVTPGKGGMIHDGIPVFNTVHEAVAATGADCSLIFVPPPGAADAIVGSADAGIPFIVAITEGIPVLDMVWARKEVDRRGSLLLGPNCPGIVTPGECKIGIAPGFIHKRGKVGIVSRSGTLTYEAVYQTTQLGLGQSTAVGIGGDPVHGLNMVDILKRFNADPETEGIVLIGEIGGPDEQNAAKYIKENVKKPVVTFIAGAAAPTGKRMGHAGAIVEGKSGTAQAKKAALKAAGAHVAETAADIGPLIKKALG